MAESLPGMLSPGVLPVVLAAAGAAASGGCVPPSLVISLVGVSAVAGVGMKEPRGARWPFGSMRIFFARAGAPECTSCTPFYNNPGIDR